MSPYLDSPQSKKTIVSKIKRFETLIPVKTISEANTHCHWATRSRRVKSQQNIIRWYWKLSDPYIDLPCVVRLTRISPRGLDYDNLVASLKYVRDAIADLIKPGLAPGQADSKDIHFEYLQQRGNPKEYSLKIEVFHEIKEAE